MNIRIAFRNGARHTEELDAHINQQASKIAAFLKQHREPVTFDVVIEEYPTHAHNRVSMHIVTPEFETNAHREGKNVYALVDEVMDITYSELCKQKEKLVDNRKHRKSVRGMLDE